MQVKICGITRLDDATHAANCGADFIGLIRAASPRRVPVETARQIADALPADISAVLVFRDNSVDEIVATLEQTGIRWVQLHGRETPEFASELHARQPAIHLIRAWECAADDNSARLLAYLDTAHAAGVAFDVVLLDVPKNTPHPGHATLARISADLRPAGQHVWCAGQLNCDNLPAALAADAYDGVDVASGVETRPGIKDPAAVERFITRCRTLGA